MHLQAGVREVRLAQQNLNQDQAAAIRNQQEDGAIVILPADEGYCTVVLDRQAYEYKVQDLLNFTAYERVKRDPTLQMRRELNKVLASIFKKHPDLRSLYLRLICRNGSAPGVYGIPEIDKPYIPFRPIVEFTTLPLLALSNLLHHILSPLVGKISTHVKNAGHFVELVSQVQLNPDYRLVSFDIVSLFTSVPVSLAGATATASLENDDKLSSKTCLSGCEIAQLLQNRT